MIPWAVPEHWRPLFVASLVASARRAANPLNSPPSTCPFSRGFRIIFAAIKRKFAKPYSSSAGPLPWTRNLTSPRRSSTRDHVKSAVSSVRNEVGSLSHRQPFTNLQTWLVNNNLANRQSIAKCGVALPENLPLNLTLRSLALEE